MKYTTASADGEDYGCYIMGYDLSKGSLSVADGDDYAQPDVVLVGPNKIQGVVAGEDDTVTLSQSHKTHTIREADHGTLWIWQKRKR